MTGIRSWICWVSSLAAVVTIAAVPCNSFAFSHGKEKKATSAAGGFVAEKRLHVAQVGSAFVEGEPRIRLAPTFLCSPS